MYFKLCFTAFLYMVYSASGTVHVLHFEYTKDAKTVIIKAYPFGNKRNTSYLSKEASDICSELTQKCQVEITLGEKNGSTIIVDKGQFDAKLVPESPKCVKEYKRGKPYRDGDFVIQCTKDGWYERQQCDDSGWCWCVSPRIGKEIPNTRKRFGANCSVPKISLTKCQQERKRGLNLARGGKYPADFAPVRCSKEGKMYCWCVHFHDGKTISGRRLLGYDPKCELGVSECVKRYRESIRKFNKTSSVNVKPGSRIKCTNDGLFEKKQCSSDKADHCWCVDEEVGLEVPRTRTNESLDCNKIVPGKKKCEKDQDRSFQQDVKGIKSGLGPPIGGNPPKCLYERHQCQGGRGVCFCVVPETGQEITNTHRRYTEIDCDKIAKEMKELMNKPKCEKERYYGILHIQHKLDLAPSELQGKKIRVPKCGKDGSFISMCIYQYVKASGTKRISNIERKSIIDQLKC